eukprot:INCI10424.2.p1 GENE.INCI10424.2~~INCI10424.2.p1  ORF type:complete len:726 (-),score=132.95 INCI10424.2:121-2298(-)
MEDAYCSLKLRQKEAVEQILNFNQPVDRTTDFAGTSFDAKNFWKILIYDDRGRDIVSPLLSVQELRAQGVTLHLNLHGKRDAIGAVPAVYFCEPTEQNVVRIAQDLADNLYSAYHLNFTHPVPRPLLERLASLAMGTGNAHKISKIHDQFLDFLTVDDRCFSLGLQDTLFKYSSPSADETQIGDLVGTVCDGIFAALVTMKVLPVIFCNSGGPSEAIARKLDEKIRQSLASRDSAFARLQFMSLDSSATVFGGKRPALVLLDRGVDLSAALRHTATYQALLEDTLRTTRTSVFVPPEDDTGTTASDSAGDTRYPLNKANDSFWAAHCDSEFHEAVEATSVQLKAVRAQEKAIRQQGGGGAGAGAGGEDAFSPAATIRPEDLSKTLESLPEILKQKKLLEQHTNILHAAMARIAARRLPEFCALETEILRSSAVPDEKELAAMIAAPLDSTTGRQGDESALVHDKLRLLAIALLEAGAGLSDEQRHGLENLIREAASSASTSATANSLSAADAGGESSGRSEAGSAGITTPTQTVDGVLTFLKMHGALAAGSEKGNDKLSTGAGGLVSPLNKGFGWANSLVSNVVKTVQSTYKGSDRALLPIVRVLDAIIGAGAGKDHPIDGMRFDPKLQTQVKLGGGSGASGSGGGNGGGKGSGGGAPNTVFRAAVVFVVGGGTIGEYQEIQKWASGKNKAGSGSQQRQVVYGATDMLKPEQMLQQLGRIGRQME